MSGILRIIDTYKINRFGTVYDVEKVDKEEIKIGDIYLDQEGNRFIIANFANIRRVDGKQLDYERFFDIVLESLDDKNVTGAFLFKKPTSIESFSK